MAHCASKWKVSVIERVLVCLLAKTRGSQIAFPSFKRHVLEELNADLALALTISDKYNHDDPYWQHARYRWTAPDYTDYGDAFDLAQRHLCREHNIQTPDWRSILRIKGIWQGGIRSEDPQPGASSVLAFCRWLLLHNLRKDGVLYRYDRFVITRSDFVWMCPHPPLSILEQNAIWIPYGEDYDGLNDRHLVASRADIVNCLNAIEDILLHPMELYEEMKHKAWWNDEQWLAAHFRRKGLLKRVKRFPYVMYLARPVDDDSPTWSSGRFERDVKLYVKYEYEFHSAMAYSMVIADRADWEQGTWKQFDPQSVDPRRISMRRILSALRRPGRVQRLVTFLKRRARPLLRRVNGPYM
jgi:hypothetical protein